MFCLALQKTSPNSFQQLAHVVHLRSVHIRTHGVYHHVHTTLKHAQEVPNQTMVREGIEDFLKCQTLAAKNSGYVGLCP